jgi:putative hydrolase of the HAD superfamily
MVLFDLDDTILDHTYAERTAAIEFQRANRGVFTESPEEFADRWQALAREHIGRYIKGELTFQEQRRGRVRELFDGRATLDDEEADRLFGVYLRCYEENWFPFPDVASCLIDLADLRVGIISNGDGDQQRRKLRVMGLAERFSPILVSGEIGVSKPNPEIFLRACFEAGEDPSKSWHVGDDPRTDVEGSTKAGLHGVWLDRKGLRRLEEPLPEGAIAISSLSELRSLIEKNSGVGERRKRC